MGLFDTPHKGVFNKPIFFYTEVDEKQLDKVKELAIWFDINFERWIICDKEITHLNLNPGIIFYSPQYNCIRGTFDNTQIMLKFDDFIQKIIDANRI